MRNGHDMSCEGRFISAIGDWTPCDCLIRTRQFVVSGASEAKQSKARVYLAGPMRGYPQFNFPAFTDAVWRLREAGYEVISPAEHDLEQGFFPFAMTGDEDLSELGFDLRVAFGWDLMQVTKADAICVLPGWEKSKGARAEVAAAAAIGLHGGTLNDFLDYSFGTAQSLWDECYSVREFIGYWDDQEPSSEEDRDDSDQRFYLSEDFDGWPDASQFVGDPHDYETRVTSSTGGQKGTKLARFDLIPSDAERELAEHFGKGAQKYERVNGLDNWRNGYEWSLSLAALRRHLNAFWAGEDIDAETGSKHTIAVAWHAFVLTHYQNRPDLAHFDDRQDKR